MLLGLLIAYALMGLLTLLYCVGQHTLRGNTIEPDMVTVIVVVMVLSAWPYAIWVAYNGRKA